MNKHSYVIGVIAIAFTTVAAQGQNLQRRASMTGGGSPDRGKCTVEVVVDGAAEVEIRGDAGTLRNLAGQSPQWRRFECNGLMPQNPQNFRFTGVDGRGSQELVRTPRNGSGAVIRIQDPNGGSEGYTFDITWGGGGQYTQQQEDRGRREGPRYTTDQVVRTCQDAVRKQAFERFRNDHIAFRKTAIDDNPGRQDWVTGFFDMRRGYDRDETWRFSCSANFETGEVRSVQIDVADQERVRPGFGNGGDRQPRVAMESCERAVETNLRQKGYQHVDFVSIRQEESRFTGTARADILYRSDTFAFSCSVEMRDGDIRSVDVRRR